MDMSFDPNKMRFSTFKFKHVYKHKMKHEKERKNYDETCFQVWA